MRINRLSGGGLFGPERLAGTESAGLPQAAVPLDPAFVPIEALTAWRSHAEEIPADQVRWHPDAMPLSVLVDDEALRPLVFQVIRQWEAATGGVVRFAR